MSTVKLSPILSSTVSATTHKDGIFVHGLTLKGERRAFIMRSPQR